MMRRKQESGEAEDEPQPMIEDFAQTKPKHAASEKQCLASANPPAAVAQRQPAVTATPTDAQISACKEPATGQPLSVDVPSKDSLPEHHIQVRLQSLGLSPQCSCLLRICRTVTLQLLCIAGKILLTVCLEIMRT